MRHSMRWPIIGLLVATLLVACSDAKQSASNTPQAGARVEQIGRISRLVLAPSAAQRLGIKSVPVAEAQVVRKGSADQLAVSGKVIPYSAVMYNTNGDTFTYVSTEALTFVRFPIVVDYITGDRAVLLEGPPLGTPVVTVGAPELYGAELGVGK